MSSDLTLNDLFLRDDPADDFGWHEERFIEQLVGLEPVETQFSLAGGIVIVDGLKRLAICRKHNAYLRKLKSSTKSARAQFNDLVYETLSHLAGILSCYQFVVVENTFIMQDATETVEDLKENVCTNFPEYSGIGDNEGLRTTLIDIINEMFKLEKLLEGVVMTENPFFVLTRRIVNHLLTSLPALTPVVPARDPKNSVFYDQRMYDQEERERDEAYRQILEDENREIEQITRELEEEEMEKRQQSYLP